MKLFIMTINNAGITCVETDACNTISSKKNRVETFYDCLACTKLLPPEILAKRGGIVVMITCVT